MIIGLGLDLSKSEILEVLLYCLKKKLKIVKTNHSDCNELFFFFLHHTTIHVSILIG